MNIKLKTKGMHCSSCEMLVKDALEDLDGVKKVEASHKSGVIAIDFDDAKVDISKIKETIKKEGYEVE